MAATVTGILKVVDRASGPMDKMRRNAERLDKALLSVGDRMDDVGTSKQLRQWDETDKQFRDMDRSVTNFGGGSGSSLGKTRTQMRGLGGDSDRLSTKLGRVAAAFTGVQKIIMALKLPLIITGVVALTQAVSALAGGFVGLLPKLMDTVGILGTLPAALTGVGLAAITAKLAFTGFSAALKGTKGAMAKLTPEAQSFVRQLKQLKPIREELKTSAQQGLFPGLGEALGSITSGRAVGTAKRLLRGMGQTLGDTAAQAATAFTRPGFLKDFERLGQQGTGLMSRLGSGLINVAHALLDVAVAAEPFTSWLAQTIQMWTVGWRESARLGRKTGELEGYFERTRAALERFGSIASNLWDTFKGLTNAARPLGEDLWQSADKATERWANFTNSIAGQDELRDYFNSLRRPIHAIFDLVGEVGGALVRLGTSGGLERTTRTLTQAVEPLERAFENIGRELGPAFAATVRELLRLFASISEQGGAFAAVVRLFNSLLSAVNGLLEHVPGLQNLLTGILGAVALQGLAGRLRSVAGSWGLVASSAGRAALAQREAAVAGGMASPAIGGGFVGGARRPMAGPSGRFYNTTPETTFIAGAGGVERAPGAGARFPWMAGGAGAAAMTGLRATGRFLAPVAGMFALSDFLGTEGDLGERTQGALSGATFGIVPRPLTGEERIAQSVAHQQAVAQHILRDVPGGSKGSIKGLRQSISRLRRQRNRLYGDEGEPGNASRYGVPAIPVLSSVFGGGDTHDDTGDTAAIRGFTSDITRLEGGLSGRTRQAAARSVMDFGSAFKIRTSKEGAGDAGEAMLTPILTRMRKLGPEGAKIIGGASLQWYREAARQNPKLRDEYHQTAQAIERAFAAMGEHVRIVNGKIHTGSEREWGAIHRALTGNATEAAREVGSAFTEMQREAVGSLVAMGYSRPVANQIVQGIEKGSPGAERASRADPMSGQVNGHLDPHYTGGSDGRMKKGARGMRIPGTGTHDTVPLTLGMAAPGELVVSRHDEADVDRDLMSIGRPPLGARVGRGRKHSDPMYGRGGRTSTAGGITSVGGYASSMGLSVSGGPGYGGIPSSGHAPNSLHYSGLAYDVSGAPAMMMNFRRAAEQRYLGHGLNELFYDPYPYYIDAGNKVTGSIGEHSDHVHIGFFPGGPNGAGAVRGLMGGAGGGFKRVKSRRSGIGGAPGAMANAAMGAYGAGLNRRLASKAGITGTAAMPRFQGGGGHLGVQQLEMLARQAHMSNPHLMAAIGMAESGGDPTVTNSIGARGLWQIIPSTASAYGLNYGRLTNPAYNAFGAAKVLSGQGLGAWEAYTNGAYQQYMATGGRVGKTPGFAGWFGSGGSVTAHGPTLLGIGDGGTETATVVKGAGAGGRRPVQVTIGAIHNNRPGDIKKQLKEEIDAAFRELRDDFDIDVDDEELIS